jgi:hypothetical protein
MHAKRLLGPAVILSALLGVACGEAPEPQTAPQPKATAQVPAAEPATADTPPQSVHRAHLDAVLREGPAWVLDRVDVEEVMNKGKFAGWRVRSLPSEWSHVDLYSGDVVTRVNGMPIERPAQLWSAWTTLTVASEVKIAYNRNGEARELSLPVVGQPDPKVAAQLRKRPQGKSAKRPNPLVKKGYKARKTITIKGEDRPLTDTRVEW